MKRADGLDTCEKICRGEVISTKDTENVANLELNPVSIYKHSAQSSASCHARITPLFDTKDFLKRIPIISKVAAFIQQ